MSISVVFENPKYISFGGLDTLKIIFDEDPVFFTPLEVERVKIVPNGFTLTKQVLNQGSGTLSQQELEER